MTDRFRRAIEAFDRLNAEDPNTERCDGAERSRELVRAERLSLWVTRLAPEASESLQLAARCQHIRRWAIPRGSFPEGRVGYLKWRSELARFHADTAERVLAEVGYDAGTIEAVRRINLKKGLSADVDTQTMEDALCLSFLEFEFEEFAGKQSDEKLIGILRKTWRKMSPRGHEFALRLPLGARAKELVRRALAEQ